MVFSTTQTNASTSVPAPITAASCRVSWATIQAKTTNTSTIRITGKDLLTGNPGTTGGFTLLNPGDSLVLWAPASLHLAIDLNEVYTIPAVGGEGVDVIAVK